MARNMVGARSVVILILAAIALAAACAPAAPSPTPTTAPAAPAATTPPAAPAPTKAAEATKAPTVAPTAAPATKVSFPAQGKPITLIVPPAAGGATDIAARVLAPIMEKELGVAVQVVNKPGAGNQLGLTELAKSPPDGYTIGCTNIPAAITIYMDPERKAVFTGKSFQPIGNQAVMPYVLAVLPDSPFKTVKDIVDAVKAKPGTVTIGGDGILSAGHLNLLQFEKLMGAKFSIVQFNGAGEMLPAFLGGHVDIGFPSVAMVPDLVKEGKIRALAVLDQKESPALPGVKTLQAQGYPVAIPIVQGISAPAGTPRGVVDILTSAIKKSTDNADYKKKMAELGFDLLYLGPDEYAKAWADMEAQVEPLMKEYIATR